MLVYGRDLLAFSPFPGSTDQLHFPVSIEVAFKLMESEQKTCSSPLFPVNAVERGQQGSSEIILLLPIWNTH